MNLQLTAVQEAGRLAGVAIDRLPDARPCRRQIVRLDHYPARVAVAWRNGQTGPLLIFVLRAAVYQAVRLPLLRVTTPSMVNVGSTRTCCWSRTFSSR